MDTNIYDCCNNSSGLGSLFESETCCKPSGPQPPCQDPVTKALNTLSNEFCDMRVTLAEAKSNLLFLTQVLCNSGCVGKTEKFLLLSLDKQLKTLGTQVDTSRSTVEHLDNLLH